MTVTLGDAEGVEVAVGVGVSCVGLLVACGLAVLVGVACDPLLMVK